MNIKKQIRQPIDGMVLGELNKRTKQEWIESAVVMKRERFEIAGALFDCVDDALLSQQEVIQKVESYFGLTTKEVIVNVDTTE
ncbi:hypothetical protein [Paenibacillus sp. FSL R10-2736]|uniref:hypothetical protein n=1 Tax=Paenibacillus sp. FSL R10-2736 TaxID=2954692 RepID=UPI0030FB571E